MRPLQNLISTMLALTFLVSFVSRSTAAEVCKQEPKPVSDEQKRISLSLPASVRKTIQADFPDFRVPSQADMKELWATESEPGSLPYFAQGDFNGDTRQDFALVLAGQKDYWFVIFHGSADCIDLVGHKVRASLQQAMTLQSVFIRTIPTGEEKVIESTGPGERLSNQYGTSSRPMHSNGQLLQEAFPWFTGRIANTSSLILAVSSEELFPL